MVRRLALPTKNYDYPVAIKSVVLAKDGMSATVNLFGTFSHNNKYIISVNGYEDLPFTASLGHPTSMKIYAEKAADGIVLTTGKADNILVKYYDEKGVEVEPENKNSVVFRLETRPTDGSYYLAGNKLTIKKTEAVATVIAEYQGRIENGKRVGQLDTKEYFFAMDQEAVVPVGITRYSATGALDNGSTTMRMSDGKGYKLVVEIIKSDGNKYESAIGVAPFDNDKYKLSFTALNPEICVVSNTTGNLTAFKDGTASFYVNLHEKKANNSKDFTEGTPIAVIDVTVQKAAYLSHVDLNNTALTIGTEAISNTGNLAMTVYNSYNEAYAKDKLDDAKVDFKYLSDDFGADAFDDAFTATIGNDGKVNIEVKADEICTVLGDSKKPQNGEAVNLYFSVAYDGKKAEFSVMVQSPTKSVEDNYIEIKSSTNYVDALVINENGKKAGKTIVFEVFEMNNTIKVAELPFEKYVTDTSAVSDGSYFYKVMKDNQDFKGKVEKDGNTVTVYLSGAENGLVSYKDAGAGTYEFALYKSYGNGKDAVLVQEYSNIVTVVLGDAGQYNVVGDMNANSVKNDGTIDKQIVKCFTIKDRKGNTVDVDKLTAADYKVERELAADAGYVYVKKITFFENVDNGLKVAYDLVIDAVLTVTQ